MLRLLPLFLFATACSSKPEIQLSVVDVWGNPVEGATIVQKGVVENIVVDDSGHASIEVEPGQVQLLASAPDYTQDLQIVDVTEDAEDLSAAFTLYPAPPRPGFFGVGLTEYDELEPYKIDLVSTEMSVYHGIEDTPKSVVPRSGNKPARFVFKTNLRKEEISRFDLRLSKLKFIDKASAKSVTGDVDIDLNLWVADEDVDYKVRGLTVEDVYLLTTNEGLKPGMYAFHAQNILNATDPVALEHLPEELRVVYPFEVK